MSKYKFEFDVDSYDWGCNYYEEYENTISIEEMQFMNSEDTFIYDGEYIIKYKLRSELDDVIKSIKNEFKDIKVLNFDYSIDNPSGERGIYANVIIELEILNENLSEDEIHKLIYNTFNITVRGKYAETALFYNEYTKKLYPPMSYESHIYKLNDD